MFFLFEYIFFQTSHEVFTESIFLGNLGDHFPRYSEISCTLRFHTINTPRTILNPLGTKHSHAQFHGLMEAQGLMWKKNITSESWIFWFCCRPSEIYFWEGRKKHGTWEYMRKFEEETHLKQTIIVRFCLDLPGCMSDVAILIPPQRTGFSWLDGKLLDSSLDDVWNGWWKAIADLCGKHKAHKAGVIELPILGGIKQCRCWVNLRDLYNTALFGLVT